MVKPYLDTAGNRLTQMFPALRLCHRIRNISTCTLQEHLAHRTFPKPQWGHNQAPLHNRNANPKMGPQTGPRRGGKTAHTDSECAHFPPQNSSQESAPQKRPQTGDRSSRNARISLHRPTTPNPCISTTGWKLGLSHRWNTPIFLFLRNNAPAQKEREKKTSSVLSCTRGSQPNAHYNCFPRRFADG